MERWPAGSRNRGHTTRLWSIDLVKWHPLVRALAIPNRTYNEVIHVFEATTYDPLCCGYASKHHLADYMRPTYTTINQPQLAYLLLNSSE